MLPPPKLEHIFRFALHSNLELLIRGLGGPLPLFCPSPLAVHLTELKQNMAWILDEGHQGRGSSAGLLVRVNSSPALIIHQAIRLAG